MKTALAFVAALVALALPTPAAAQQPPPPTGMATVEGTMKSFYAASHTVIVATLDGVEHVFHSTKDLIVHGGKSSGPEGLQGLNEGTTVVVHYTTRGGTDSADEIDQIGGEGLRTTEGTVVRVDRGRREITIRYDTGTRETLRLTDRAAAEAKADVAEGTGSPTRVIVYYANENGQKVAHYFRKVR